MNDADRIRAKLRESTNGPKYAPGHTEHTDDCMSPWGENARGVMTPETIAANHVLHMADPVYVDPQIVGCPTCGANAKRPCTYGTPMGRQEIRWFHPAREDRARETNG